MTDDTCYKTLWRKFQNKSKITEILRARKINLPELQTSYLDKMSKMVSGAECVHFTVPVTIRKFWKPSESNRAVNSIRGQGTSVTIYSVHYRL